MHSLHLRIDRSANPQSDGDKPWSLFGDGPVTMIYKKSAFEDFGFFLPLKSRADIIHRQILINKRRDPLIGRIDAPLLLAESTIDSTSNIYQFSSPYDFRALKKYIKTRGEGLIEDHKRQFTWLIPSNFYA